MAKIDLVVVFFPLLAAILAGFGGHRLGDRFAQVITCCSMLITAILSVFVFKDVALEGAVRTHHLATWIEAGGFKANWALRVDTLSAIMMMVVSGVSAMVHVYAVGYMHGDRGVPRFMAYLSLFTFFMLMLVTADNLLQMFFGWEGVGLCSYLLIGFWIERPKANAAAMKAFLVNRVGDFGFILGLFGCYQLFGTLNFDVIFKTAPELVERTIVLPWTELPVLSVIAFLLFIGAMGKSAQIGLHTWLPDAMEGPTPVSALIHAATMVTAGVFMVARLSPLFELAPTVLAFITLIGALTAVFAATIGMTQYDIKRVIAYSTMSQLGYMFFAAGVSAYGASMFHLTTHAFFKALLFLAAGSVIHALNGEQDMRKMGGLYRKLPVTYALMWIGSLALAGIGVEGLFGFAGFYSKDMILEAAFARGTGYGAAAYAMGLLAAFMTGFYSWRLLILTFHGEPQSDAETVAQAHEAPKIMLLPLIPLALGAIFAGYVGHDVFSSAPAGDFWRGSIFVQLDHLQSEGHGMPTLARFLPLVAALAGIGLSCWFYLHRPEVHHKIVKKLGPVHKAAHNKYYFDEIYDRLFVKSAHALGRVLHHRGSYFDELYDIIFVRAIKGVGSLLWRRGDIALIDRIGPDGLAALSQKIADALRRVQTGYLDHYALVMALGLIGLLGWVFVKG